MNKFNKILLSLLASTLVLTSCSVHKKDTTDDDTNTKDDENKDDKKDDENNDKKINYTYGDLKIYDGSITSSISLDILPSLGINLSLYSGYITFAYQTINEDITLSNIKEAFKFHLNVDLYSNQETFESSLITSSLIPLIASDFKYQTILNNATDFDVYYNADGLLYFTISRFKDVKNPSRSDRNYLRSLKREVIGTSCLDLSSVFDMLAPSSSGSSSSSLSVDISSIISMFSKYLNGFSFNIGKFNKLIDSLTLTILDGGINIKIEDEGLSILSLFINKVLNLVLSALNINIKIDESAPLINLSNIDITYSSLELSINIECDDSLSSLMDISLKRNDSLSFNMESSLNLEEDYLIQKAAIKKIDNLYSLYDNIDISSSSYEELNEAIKVINEMNDEEFKRVENFNDYLNYSLLNKNSEDKYDNLLELDNLKALYASLIKLYESSLNSDYEVLNALLSLNTFYNKKYSTNIKNNIINKLKENYSDLYDSFNTKMKEYIINYLDSIKEEIDNLFNNYYENEITLSSTRSLIESIYNLTVSSYIITKDDEETFIDFMDEDDEIKLLDNDTINMFTTYFDIEHELFNDTYSQKIYTLISDYFSDTRIMINNIKNNDIKEFNEYSTYLYINNSDIDFYSIFSVISNNNSTYLTLIKKMQDDLISSLIKKINNFALTRIDEVTSLYKINFMLNETIIDQTIEKLDSIYNMLNVFISSSLYKKFEASFTYIDEYYLLKEALENQKVNISINN